MSRTIRATGRFEDKAVEKAGQLPRPEVLSRVEDYPRRVNEGELYPTGYLAGGKSDGRIRAFSSAHSKSRF